MWNPSKSASDTLFPEALRGKEDFLPSFSFWQYPIFWVILSTVCGFVLGVYFLPPFLPLFLLLGGLFIAQVLSFSSRTFSFFFLLSWGVFGVLFCVVNLEVPRAFFREKEMKRLILEGCIVERNGQPALVSLKGFPVYSPVVLLRGNIPDFSPFVYREAKVSGTFRSFTSCANPGGQDLRVHFWKRRVVGYLEVDAVTPAQSRNPWFTLLRWVWERRTAFLEQWKQELQEVYPLFSALFLGARDEGFVEEASVFQEVGVYHLFCVSGFHMALLGSMFWLLLQRVLPRRMALFGVLPFTFLYLAFCGFVASAVRAWLMMSLLLLSKRLGRTVTTVGILLSAFFIMFLLQPEILFAPGAQLSFASTAGIVLFSPLFRYSLDWRSSLAGFFIRYCAGVFFVTLGVLLASFPFLVVNRLSFTSLVFVGNLVVLPLVEGTLFLALWTPLLGICSGGRHVLGFCLRCLLKLLLRVSVILKEGVPHGVISFVVGRNILWGMVLWGVVILLLLGLFTRRRMLIAVLSLSLILGGLALGWVWFPKTTFIVFDVGQGLACGFFEENTGIFIDAGGVIRGYGNVGQSVLLPFLRFRGITEIRGIFLTHRHRDHTEGIGPLSAAFSGMSLFFPECFSFLERWRVSRDAILEIFPVSDGTKKAAIYRLHTPYGRILICGDIKDTFHQLARYGSSFLRAEVLVLPHHGSYDSSLEYLVSASQCFWVIISAGENPYGHPDPRTIDLLERMGMPYFITGRDGAVEYFSVLKQGRIRKIGKRTI